MRERLRCVAIVPAGGSGSRLGAAIPKQYLSLLGRPILAHTVQALLGHEAIERVYVNVQAEDPHAEAALSSFAQNPRLRLLRQAGPTRAESVSRALQSVQAELDRAAWVLVHDAVRPCLSRGALERLLAVRDQEAVGALLALPLTDTLKRASPEGLVEETLPRNALWRAQTPQMFRYETLLAALLASPDVTDEAQAIEALGLSPRLILGEAHNIKITHAEDLALAEYWLQS